MADCATLNKLDESMTRLKSMILSEVSTPKLADTYVRVIDGFTQFYRQNAESITPLQDVLKQYYEYVTKAKPFSRPGSTYLVRLARPVLMIRDQLAGQSPQLRYSFNTLEIPHIFTEDMRYYSEWLVENNCAQGTIKTRIGRIKQFLYEIQGVCVKGLSSLTSDILVNFIRSLYSRYSSSGKTNILYTVRNYFSCPYIKLQLEFDPSPFLVNLHSNRHERLDSCYTPEEIRRVLNVVDRSTANGKMHYLIMILAGLYGLRSCDIRSLKFSNIDWKRQLIIINQRKTKRYLELPLIQEVLLAMLDYIKNGRPASDDQHIFIRERSPHVPYSNENHFSDKVSKYFKKAEIPTDNKHCGLHSMRHSLATSLLGDGVQINDIATILGHVSPQSTTRYLWSDIEKLRAVALEVIPYVVR